MLKCLSVSVKFKKHWNILLYYTKIVKKRIWYTICDDIRIGSKRYVCIFEVSQQHIEKVHIQSAKNTNKDIVKHDKNIIHIWKICYAF